MRHVHRLCAIATLSVAVSSVGCDEANPVGPTGLTSAEAFIAAIRGQGATVVREEVLAQSSNPFFATNGQLLVVNDGNVSVFEYQSVAAAESDASKVSPDGSLVGSTIITWIGPPHFYKSGPLIVLYAGSSDLVLGPLQAVLGPPFAQRQ